MEQSAVFHKGSSSYAYAYNREIVHIKLQTKKDDVQAAELLWGDPYDYRERKGEGKETVWDWHGKRVRMEKIGDDGIHDFWFAQVRPEWKRMRYAFCLKSGGQEYLYGEQRFCRLTSDTDPELFQPLNFFCFPYINQADVFRAPDWVKDTVWYQIFPERFANGDRSNDPEDKKAWEEDRPTPWDYYGGDLQGVMDHLDYLQELGVNGIYFTPIFQSRSNHKYDTIDYLAVDPHFGSQETLVKLVEEAHARGIRIMLDIVFNHSGFYFQPFQDVVEYGQDSSYKDWFHIHGYPVYDSSIDLYSSKVLNFESFAFTPSMPKLNTENPQTREYLLDVIRYWSDIAPIDAWRLDVASEVDHAFWREFRKVVKEKNSQAYIIGEVWHDANPWLAGDQFDAVMNYPLRDAATDFFAKELCGAEDFARRVNRVNFQYPRQVNAAMYNLLDSHDTARFLNQAGERKERLKLAYVFMMTHTGAPSVYYGNEVGMTGGQDPDCRRPMIWEPEKQDRELLEFMKKLLGIRRKHSVLRDEGGLRFIPAGNPDILLYQRFTGKEVYSVLMNRSDERNSLELPEDMRNQSCLDLWQEEELCLKDALELEPYGYYILKHK